jgi:hypothetical protein
MNSIITQVFELEVIESISDSIAPKTDNFYLLLTISP